MPELPEVQTTISGLQILTNKRITNIKIFTTKLRYLVPQNIDKILKNKKISIIYRIAKYIIFEMNKNTSLIFHLGMSGRIKLVKLNKYKNKKHDHIFIYIEKKTILIFNDPRKFGFVDISSTSKLKNKKYFLKLGLDPFDKALNSAYLINKFKKTKSSIKQLLINQEIIAGIGNIYACEILYDAKISPFIPGYKLQKIKIERLILSIKKILKLSISYGGTSIRNYKSTDGVIGNFQSKFKVYNKEGQKIQNFKIIRIKQNGRSTFFCPKLQKSKYNPISD